MRSFVIASLLASVACAFVVGPVVQGKDKVVDCELCEIAVRVVAPTIGRDVQGVDNEFIKECEKVIPGKIGQVECTNYANKEFGNIIKELESGTAPKDVCTKIHSC